MFTALRSSREVLGQRLHPIDEAADPVRLVDDELRQGDVLGASRGPEQLGRAAYTSEGVLHLVREHLAKPHHRLQSALVRRPVRPNLWADMQGDQGQAIAEGIAPASATIAWGRDEDFHLARANRRAFVKAAPDQRPQRRAVLNHGGQAAPATKGAPEELLRGFVGGRDLLAANRL